jgi:hypothetical protein
MSLRANDATIHLTAENTGTDSVAQLSEVDAEVIRAIRNIRYGSVEVTIHDSRVVQIERKEKRRFAHTNSI